VQVEDQNDNSPYFPLLPQHQTKFKLDVPVNQTGHLTRVVAADVDAEGPNSDLEYRLVNAAAGFSVDRHGLISNTKPMKAGDKSSFLLVVRDLSQPSRESNITLELMAIGRPMRTTNRKKPRLVERELWKELFVSDSDSVGTILGIMKAVDEEGDLLWWRIDEASNPNMSFTVQTHSSQGSDKGEASAELVS